MQAYRVGAIYSTMQRAIRDSTERDKGALFKQLLDTAADFDRNWKALTASQEAFDAWFNHQIETFQSMQFRWTDARKMPRTNITFGLCQKFINLMLKDWWSLKSEQLGANCAVLHAPFDNVVWDKLSKLTRIHFPSLSQGGYYVHLSRADYDKYQAHLISLELARALGIPTGFHRIAVEQILWE
jgi:hypothetical protein